MQNELTKEETRILLMGLKAASESGYSDSWLESLELICKYGDVNSINISSFQKESDTLIESLIQAHKEGYYEATNALHEVYLYQIVNATSKIDNLSLEDCEFLGESYFNDALNSYNVKTDGDLSQFIYEFIVRHLNSL